MRSIAVATVALAAVACDKHARGRSDSTAIATRTTATTSATPSDCPRTGHWTPCQVKKRLEQSGVAPRDSTLTGLPALGAAPITYAVGTATLAVYLFPDAAARARAARTLDSTTFVAPSHEMTMRHAATAIENDNLLALLFTHRDQPRERVSDAFMAGAPQP